MFANSIRTQSTSHAPNARSGYRMILAMGRSITRRLVYPYFPMTILRIDLSWHTHYDFGAALLLPQFTPPSIEDRYGEGRRSELHLLWVQILGVRARHGETFLLRNCRGDSQSMCVFCRHVEAMTNNQNDRRYSCNSLKP